MTTNAQNRAKRLLVFSSLTLAAACAVALANTDEQAATIQTEQQAGRAEQSLLTEDPTLRQTEPAEVTTPQHAEDMRGPAERRSN